MVVDKFKTKDIKSIVERESAELPYKYMYFSSESADKTEYVNFVKTNGLSAENARLVVVPGRRLPMYATTDGELMFNGHVFDRYAERVVGNVGMDKMEAAAMFMIDNGCFRKIGKTEWHNQMVVWTPGGLLMCKTNYKVPVANTFLSWDLLTERQKSGVEMWKMGDVSGALKMFSPEDPLSPVGQLPLYGEQAALEVRVNVEMKDVELVKVNKAPRVCCRVGHKFRFCR